MFLGLKEKLRVPYFSSPAVKRERDREAFEKVTIQRTASLPSFPNIAEVGTAPEFTTKTNADGGLSVEYSYVESHPGNDALADVFVADINNEVVLPTGVRLKLTGMALTLPEDSPGTNNVRYPEVDTSGQWLDPLTLEPRQKDPWLPDSGNNCGSPTLHLSVKSEGGPPVRWLPPVLHDGQTMTRASGQSWYATIGQGGLLQCRLDSWHSTQLIVSILVAYGEPETRELTLKINEQVEFGTGAFIKVVTDIPAHLRFSGSGSGSTYRVLGETQFHADYRNRSPGGRRKQPKKPKEFGLFIRPKQFVYTTSYQTPVMKSPSYLRAAEGGYLPTEVDLADWKEGAPNIQLTQLPKMARVVFRIPKLPRLPESDNLFSTPIRKAVIESPSNFDDLISGAIQSRNQIYPLNRDLNPDDFPMTFENTTPLELLREFERLTSTAIYFDESEMALTTQRPLLFWERWESEVKTLWKRYFP
ncbi:MAG: hypothetical protein P1U86_20365 [Verrucomicrobiales bacterium]|nr:hypothetical protein [Verrucomicrobiales bacterium]